MLLLFNAVLGRHVCTLFYKITYYFFLGAVMAARHFKNPVLMSRKIMEESPHCALTGEGALELAKRLNCTQLIVDPEALKTETIISKCKYKYEDYKENVEKCLGIKRPDSYPTPSDTVCAVAMDGQGHFACATSTGITIKASGCFSALVWISDQMSITYTTSYFCSTGK